MNKNESLQSEIPFRQKIALVLFGVFLFFVLLEVGLRLGGFILLFIQEDKNLQSIKQKGTYRILCLGESTTQREYPQFLEEVLNQRNIGVHFSVVDKGKAGTTTPAILSQVESYLAEYHPDMVVTMMGINDCGDYMPYEALTNSKIILFFKSFKTYKLTKLLWLHILNRAKEIGVFKPDAEKRPFGETQAYFPKNGLGPIYAESILTEDAFKKAIDLNPKDDNAYFRLGWVYKAQGKLADSEQAFKKVIELNPKNYNAYTELGWLYRVYGKISQAEDLFKKAINLNPKNYRPHVELGWLYLKQSKFLQAEDLFKKAIKLNPKNDNAYFGLGQLYLKQSKFPQAEDLFKKAIEFNSKNDDNAYFGLGQLYLKQSKFPQAEDLFKKAIELNPKYDRICGATSSLYEEINKPELAKEYARKANTARLKHYSSITVDSYRKLREILNKRGVRLVCAQYPMRNIQPLKKIFENDIQGVVFVDNEMIFRDLVRQNGARVYFRDMFAGDFGHCTQKGNRLLAQNIANVITKELFSK